MQDNIIIEFKKLSVVDTDPKNWILLVKKGKPNIGDDLSTILTSIYLKDGEIPEIYMGEAGDIKEYLKEYFPEYCYFVSKIKGISLNKGAGKLWIVYLRKIIDNQNKHWRHMIDWFAKEEWESPYQAVLEGSYYHDDELFRSFDKESGDNIKFRLENSSLKINKEFILKKLI
jgi:hypothetical protein